MTNTQACDIDIVSGQHCSSHNKSGFRRFWKKKKKQASALSASLNEHHSDDVYVTNVTNHKTRYYCIMPYCTTAGTFTLSLHQTMQRYENSLSCETSTEQEAWLFSMQKHVTFSVDCLSDITPSVFA